MTTSKIRPLGDRILIERIDEAVQKSPGGIIIPDTAKEKPTQGKVIAVGPGRRADDGKMVKPDVAEGDKVLFGKWGGTEIKIDGKEYVILREEDVYGVIA